MSILARANPSYGSGQVIAVTTTSQNVTLPVKSKQVIFTNLGTNPAYVRMTPAAVAATTADAIVPVGAPVVYTKGEDITTISIVSTGGTATVHVMPAEGF